MACATSKGARLHHHRSARRGHDAVLRVRQVRFPRGDDFAALPWQEPTWFARLSAHSVGSNIRITTSSQHSLDTARAFLVCELTAITVQICTASQ